MVQAATDFTLIADIGGTNGRFALSAPEKITAVKHYLCDTFKTPCDLIRAYCHDVGIIPKRGIIAVAANGGTPENVIYANGPWAQVSTDFTLAGIDVETINDFAAIVCGVGALTQEHLKPILPGNGLIFFPSASSSIVFSNKIMEPLPEQRFIVVGPGTGLGAGTGWLQPDGTLTVLSGEGGHTKFAPDTYEELALAHLLGKNTKNGFVSNGMLCSGKGLVNIFNGLATLRGVDSRIKSADSIMRYSEDKTHHDYQLAKDTLSLFSKTLGTCASTVALVNDVRMVYIGGGIVGKLGGHFDVAAFKKAFLANDLDEGDHMQDVPVHLITHPYPGLIGCHVRANALR